MYENNKALRRNMKVLIKIKKIIPAKPNLININKHLENIKEEAMVK